MRSSHTSEALIIDAVRTPVGKYGGSLKDVRPDDLSAIILRALVARAKIDPAFIDDVLWGCANQAGEDNRNVARMATLLAGFPHTVPASTINRLCGSSLDAINHAARALWSGDFDIVIAGGVESMTRAPYVLPKNVSGEALYGNLVAYDTALGWRFPNPAMEKLIPLESMGETAENVAERWKISREDQDAFALRSHQRAVKAQTDCLFKEEIAPVEIQTKKNTIVVEKDEGPRPDTSMEKLAVLKPVFRNGGTVTAGNSSSLNDGAAAILMMSEAKAKEMNVKPLARIVSTGVAGVDPRIMGIGPVPATTMALRKAGLKISDIGLMELNEAFAAQSLACIRDLNIDPEIVNVNGGAIALGHPLGCSGARITTTLLHEMKRRKTRYGVATMCIGVGQGIATIIEGLW
ncbi:MAG TPA: thiolase family protein [Bacteroidota bacterium]|nr:thiolase family protein [Bacteroidota bacterium]